MKRKPLNFIVRGTQIQSFINIAFKFDQYQYLDLLTPTQPCVLLTL